MANLNINQLPPLGGAVSDTDLFILQSGIGTFRVTGAQLREAFGGGGGGTGTVESIEAGAGISVNDSDPANPVVSNTGVIGITAGANVTVTPTGGGNYQIAATGGGGGGGVFSFHQALKTGTNNTIVGDDLTPTGATLVVTNLSDLNIDLSDYTGSALLVINAITNSTLTSVGGSSIIDKSSSAVSSIEIAQYETVQLVALGDGNTWSCQVIGRY